MPPAVKHRSWMVTWNNYDKINPPPEVLEKSTYFCLAQEEAPTTGTPHLQCFVYWTAEISKFQLGKQFTSWDKTVHIGDKNGSPNFGTPEQCKNYCLGLVAEKGNKPNPTFKEWGTLPVLAGLSFMSRPDQMREAVKRFRQGDTESVLQEAPALYMSHYRVLLAHHVPKSIQPRALLENYWFTGPTGSYKSRCADNWKKDTITTPPTTTYMPATFVFQNCLHIEEVTVNHRPDFSVLSQYADHKAFLVRKIYEPPTWYRPGIVIVTSNRTIDQVYPLDAAALHRRFKTVEFKSPAHGFALWSQLQIDGEAWSPGAECLVAAGSSAATFFVAPVAATVAAGTRCPEITKTSTDSSAASEPGPE